MAPKSKNPVVKQEHIHHAISFFSDLPEKSKETVSLREAVELMKEPLRAAMAKGYTHVDLAEILTQQGIKISALTLKNYLPSGKRLATKGKTLRPRKAKVLAPVVEPTVPATPEPEPELPAPKPTKAKSPKAPSPETPQTEAETPPTPPTTRRRRTTAAKAASGNSVRAKSTRSRKPATTKSSSSASPKTRKSKSV